MNNLSKLLTVLRNALLVKKKQIQVVFSSQNLLISEILRTEGFIKSFSIKNNMIIVYNRFYKQSSLINIIKQISKPGVRIYMTCKQIYLMSINSLGVYIISTSKGLMTNFDAKNQRLGGEVLCYIS